LFAPHFAHFVGNKRWVVVSAFAQALTLVPIAVLTVSDGSGFDRLFLFTCLYWMLALGISPPWNAWMGHMIPARIRSRYFGRRNVPIQASLFVSLVAAGMLIHAAELSAWGAAPGFLLIFCIAALSRFVSAYFLTRQHEPAPGQIPRTPLRKVIVGLTQHPYGRVIRLIVLMNAAVHVSAAYFTPFMLAELKLSYAQFTVLNATILVARLLSSAYWGEIARNFGNRRALQVSTVLLIPLAGLWVVSDNFLYLFALQIVAGFAWAGYELMTVLSFFDTTDNENRARVLSVFNLFNAVAIVVASLVGGAILRLFGNAGYMYIFLGSTVLRLLIALVFARGAGMRRPVEHTFRNVFVRVVSLRPGQGQGLRPIVMPNDDTPVSNRSDEAGQEF
jgi:MFS family permease